MCRTGLRPGSGHSLGPGFTLVELTLALVLIGITASIAAPRFFRRDGFDERLFLDDLRAAVGYGQKLAVASGCEVAVSFPANGYALAQRSACATSGPFDQPVLDPGSRSAPYANSAAASVVVTSDVDPIVFDALGRARDGLGNVTGANLTVGARSLQVVGETGLVFLP